MRFLFIGVYGSREDNSRKREILIFEKTPMYKILNREIQETGKFKRYQEFVFRSVVNYMLR